MAYSFIYPKKLDFKLTNNSKADKYCKMKIILK